MKHKHYLVWVLTIGAFVRCSAVTGSQEENELNDVELASLALGVVALSEAALPELRGSWKDANNNTFTVSLNNGTWIAYGNNVQYSFSATHTIRSYNNSVRRYFFECTAQTGFGCTVARLARYSDYFGQHSVHVRVSFESIVAGGRGIRGYICSEPVEPFHGLRGLRMEQLHKTIVRALSAPLLFCILGGCILPAGKADNGGAALALLALAGSASSSTDLSCSTRTGSAPPVLRWLT
jgi:hypothetical protein